MKILFIILSIPLAALALVLFMLGVITAAASWACMTAFLSIGRAILVPFGRNFDQIKKTAEACLQKPRI